MIRVHFSNGTVSDVSGFTEKQYSDLVKSMLGVTEEGWKLFHLGLMVLNINNIDYMEWLKLAEDPDESI